MPPSILLTGATGFVGGSILHALTTHHSTTPIQLLVRTAAKGESCLSAYQNSPNLSYTTATLSSPILSTLASQASILILAADIDNSDGIANIIAGLKRSIHINPLVIMISGAGSLFDMSTFKPGSDDAKTWSDVDDIDEIDKLPETRSHVLREREMKTASREVGFRLAILAPPFILHTGEGVGVKHSYPNLWTSAILDKVKQPFVLNEGLNGGAWVSTADLADAVLFLMREAEKGEDFGHGGYFYVDSGGEFLKTRDVIEVVGKELVRLGAIETAEVKTIRTEEDEGSGMFDIAELLMFGWGMKTRGDTLGKLGWRAKVTDWRPLVRDIQRREVEKWSGRAE